MRWKILLIGIFAIIIAWFTLVNATTVSVDFLFVTATTSLIFVILIAVVLGMSLMAVLWSARAWKMRRLTKGLRQQVAKLQDELSDAHEELADLHSQLATQADQEANASDTTSGQPKTDHPTHPHADGEHDGVPGSESDQNQPRSTERK